METEKSCAYRNCKKVIFGRKNKKYCNRKCKGNENKYRQRWDKLLEEHRKINESIKNLIDKIKYN